jgi:uncharacterized OsmC-like protein
MNAKIMNGVDVKQLGDTIEAIAATPRVASFQFRAAGRWIDGGHNRTTIQEFDGACQRWAHPAPFALDADEPPVLLGTDRGPNPVEYVLAGLAGCLTTSLVYHAAARGIRIDRVETRLEGDLDLRGFLGMDDTVRNGYEKVRVTFRVKGDATDEQLEELCRVAQQRSPVFDIVSNPVPVEVKLERAKAMQPAA